VVGCQHVSHNYMYRSKTIGQHALHNYMYRSKTFGQWIPAGL